MKRLWHLPLLIATGCLSFFGLRYVDLFAGPSTGDVVLGALAFILLLHLLALAVGFLFDQRTLWRAPLIALIALIPIGLLLAGELHDHYVVEPQLPYDRFRDQLVSPIPSSVTNLRFVPYERSEVTHLMLAFSITPEDLDEIIEQLGFEPTDPELFRCPVDEFKDPAYLPLPGPVAYYTYEDNVNGYPEPGWGDGHTLKVSADRTRVIYRHESAPFYRYRYWESE